MKRILSAAAVAAVLAIGSSAVFAQTVPTQPVSGPIPTPDSGNSGLIFWAYDATRNVSLVDYLGLSFESVLPTGTEMTNEGKVLDFGTIGSFSSTFAASQNSNIFWGVAAADFLGGVTSTRIVSTGPVGSTDLFMNAAGLTSAAGKINDFILAVNSACANANPCTANDPNQGQYAGTSLWADNFGGGLGWQATANPGSALGFYLVNAASGPRPTGAVVTPYQAAGGAYGQWLLDATGNLSYSVEGNSPAPVPLPAGVWLLLSGLSGLVTVARRRNAASA